MSHMQFEWVKRRQVAFNTTASGEKIVAGDPIDVGDWEEMVVQVDTLATEGSPASGDIKVNVQTAISSDEFVAWDDCLSDTNVSVSVEGYVILKVTPTSTNGLRKYARLVIIHNAAAAQKITMHAWGLLKKRTP